MKDIKIANWLIDAYGALGSQHPRISLCVIALLGALIFGLGWKVLGYQWEQKKAAEAKQAISYPDGNHNQNIQTNNGTAVQNNDK
jgi:hypothetical protein